jgi:hypothetical protein
MSNEVGKLPELRDKLNDLNAKCTAIEDEYRALAAEQRQAEQDRKLARDKEQERLSRLPGAKLGMSAKAVVEKTSWGKPVTINRTTTAHGTSEQWVYNSGYLYFTNGVLTAIQN